MTVPAWVAPLRDALDRAGYRYDGVAGLLGGDAHAALSRNETVPGLRATGGGSPVETLTRLWLLQAVVPVGAVEQALPGLVDPLCAEGVLERSVGEVVARVDVRPYATDGRDLWVAADLTPGLDGSAQRIGPDHVLGISPAATSLAQLTVRRPVDGALDLGTGCGVQALHLAGHAARVVATDVNPRALWFTELNAALDGVDLDVRRGSLFGPVRGERFDLVTTNPPFVIGPAPDRPLVYRDSGLPGDEVVEAIVRGCRAHLTDGGIGQVLANWMVRRGEPWQDRLAHWVPDDCDAWVVQRELADLPAYVEMWLKDAGLHPATGGHLEDYRRRYDGWLGWFEDRGAEAVGFGWITLRRTTGSGSVRLEEWPFEVAQPVGAEVAAHLDRVSWLRATDAPGLVAARLRLREDVVQETVGAAGAADPTTIVVRQQTGLRRARQVGTAEAALLGACDGEIPVGPLLAAVAELTGAEVSVETVRELVAEGWLVPGGAEGR